MSYPTFLYSPHSSSDAPERGSLYENRHEFTARLAPIAMAAIYFGGFSLAARDAPLARQALFKLSFVYRHFLVGAGVRVVMCDSIASLTGPGAVPLLLQLGETLARQIDGIDEVRTQAEAPQVPARTIDVLRLLFATDQTVRSGVDLSEEGVGLVVSGLADSEAQRAWMEQLAGMASATINSRVRVAPGAVLMAETRAPILDDESLQALVVFRLGLAGQAEPRTWRVKAHNGVVTLQGKAGTEARRQRVENLTRSTLGVRELRSSISIGA